jgi:hypothetical protein
MTQGDNRIMKWIEKLSLELVTLSYLEKQNHYSMSTSSKLDHFRILNELSTFKCGHSVYITSEVHF